MSNIIDHPNLPGYVSVKEASQMLGVSVKRVHMFIEEERLAAVWAGKSLMIKLEDVQNFQRKASGRQRKIIPAWRLSDRWNSQFMTYITVLIRPEQEKALMRRLAETRRNGKHLFPGTVARYISQNQVDPDQIDIILVWRGPIMPDESTREIELTAFRNSFADVLDWSTAHYENRRVLMHT